MSESLGVDLSPARRYPEWDFAKLSVAHAKPNETYFQPGQYNVNIEAQPAGGSLRYVHPRL